jgi:hypothetical protein
MGKTIDNVAGIKSAIEKTIISIVCIALAAIIFIFIFFYPCNNADYQSYIILAVMAITTTGILIGIVGILSFWCNFFELDNKNKCPNKYFYIVIFEMFLLMLIPHIKDIALLIKLGT